MKNPQDIRKLQALAQMVLESKLAELRNAAQARSTTIAHLADLKPAEVFIADKIGVAEASAALAYQQWADARRADLNRTLAQQTAHWMDLSDDARTAFGRSDVLQSLSKRLVEPRRN